MKTVLITGGAGFLGSHLCELFLKKGFSVLCVDNEVTGRKDNIEPFLENPNFTFMHHDVTTPFKIDQEIHYLLHFASPASPVDYQKIPIPTLKVGSLGTMNALELAKEKKAVFLLASTSEVYGDPQVNPQPETYWGNVNPVGPRGCYDEAKRFSEAMTVSYRDVHNIDAKIVRIFNTFGPKMRLDDGRVVPNFIGQALRGEPLTIYGKGQQTRSFCYVQDLIEGIYALLMSNHPGPMNIGNPEEHSILEFAEIVKKLVGSDSEIVHKDLPVDDPQVRRPDIALAKKELGWAPQVSLEEGMKRTIEWFSAQQKKA